MRQACRQVTAADGAEASRRVHIATGGRCSCPRRYGASPGKASRIVDPPPRWQGAARDFSSRSARRRRGSQRPPQRSARLRARARRRACAHCRRLRSRGVRAGPPADGGPVPAGRCRARVPGAQSSQLLTRGLRATSSPARNGRGHPSRRGGPPERASGLQRWPEAERRPSYRICRSSVRPMRCRAREGEISPRARIGRCPAVPRG